MTNHIVKYTSLRRGILAVIAVAFSFGSTASLHAAIISINYVTASGADGTLTYIDNPAITNPARDAFNANIVSPQFGNGTLSVPNDFTNYVTGTGHANVSSFVFAAGTFTGTEDAVINFATGSVVVTYGITSGTGAFAGATGTITEAAHFTSLGSFSPNVPATAKIDSASGTLTTVPEPGTILSLALGLLGCGLVKKANALRNSPS